MSNPLDTQVGGGHYKDLKIQPVEFIHANGLGFMEGAVIKYVARHKAKNGRQDLEKAIHFLQLLLELEYPEAASIDHDDPFGVAAEVESAEQASRWPVRIGGGAGYAHHCQCNETAGCMFSDPREFAECPSCGQSTQGKWHG